MLTFSHPNVMQLIGLSFDGEMPLIIMPFMSKGTVLGYVREHRDNLYITESVDKNQVEQSVNDYVNYYIDIIIACMIHRLSQPRRRVWGCVTRFQRECLTLQNTSLFTATLQPGTACK